MNDLTKVYNFAKQRHAGQFRRDGKTPYFTHVEAVAGSKRLALENSDVISAALLHDLLEDTDTTIEDLRKLPINNEVINAVIAITKIPTQSYIEYLAKVKVNLIATKVKIADMLHNLSDSPTNNQIRKYAKGLLFLIES